MIDLNYSLRIAYFSALSDIGVPVYYQSIPPNSNPDDYIVFRSITSTDASTKSSADTETTVTVEIHTKSDVINRGLNADTLARDVYNRIYPNQSTQLLIAGGQMINTRIVSDTVQNMVMNGAESFVSRFIIFKHKIYQSSDIS